MSKSGGKKDGDQDENYIALSPIILPFAIQFKRQIKGFLQENMPQLKFKSGLFH